MWRSKKFIVVALVAAVVLVGSTAGVVLANTGNEDDSQSGTQYGALLPGVGAIYKVNAGGTINRTALLDRVCEIYNANPDRPGDIDCDMLKDAFADAQSELQLEALKAHLAKLVEDGKITQAQADEYLEWWQARPGIPPELKEWQAARPDVPIGFGFHRYGGFRGMGEIRGWGGRCAPWNK